MRSIVIQEYVKKMNLNVKMADVYRNLGVMIRLMIVKIIVMKHQMTDSAQLLNLNVIMEAAYL